MRTFQNIPKRLPFPFICLKYPTTFEFMHLIDLNGFLAQATAPQTGQPQQPAWMTFAPMILLVIVFYFILIRPQQQRAKQQAKLISNLKSGDKVVTAAGIIGVVITVKDQTVSLRSADAKMEVTKSSVTEIIEGGSAAES
jgi:preprotein translocase subunit YajC